MEEKFNLGQYWLNGVTMIAITAVLALAIYLLDDIVKQLIQQASLFNCIETIVVALLTVATGFIWVKLFQLNLKKGE